MKIQTYDGRAYGSLQPSAQELALLEQLQQARPREEPSAEERLTALEEALELLLSEKTV